MFRTVEIFDYRTFLVAGAFAFLLLVGYLLFGAVQGAHDANVTANQRGKAATRRIDGLQQIIAGQAQTIAELLARESARAAEQRALAEQVSQLGGKPVVSPRPAETAYVVRSPSPAPQRSAAPRPTPSQTRRPTPAPTPSPTCSPFPIIGCRR